MTISARFPKVDRAVNYGQFRKDILSGDILLCSGSGVFSRMIQAATKSDWSHVAFVMRLDAIDRVMVLESVEPLGVRTVPLSKYLRDYDNDKHPYPGGLVLARHRDFAARATKERLADLGRFAVDLFGYPYDKDEIAKIAARIAGSFLPFTRADRKAIERDREYICSEYAWECYNYVGLRIEHDPKGFVAPADFARAREIELQAVLRKKP